MKTISALLLARNSKKLRILLPVLSVTLMGLAMLIVIDRVVFPKLEDERCLVSKGWKEETYYLSLMSAARENNPPDVGVWMSPGISVSEKKSKAKRIIVVGDSYVIGYALANINDAWWRILQRELVSRGYNDVEVVGMHSLLYGNTAGELLQVEQWAKKYQPDILIWGYSPSDPEEFSKTGLAIVPRLRPKKDSAIEKFVKRTCRSLFPNISQTVLEYCDRQYAANVHNDKDGYESRLAEVKYFQGANLKQYRQTLAGVKNALADLHVPSFIMTLPGVTSGMPEGDIGRRSDQYFTFLDDYYKTRFAMVFPLLREFGLKYYDITGSFVKSLRSQSQFANDKASVLLTATPADAHPGAFITHLFATQAADILENDYRQTLGPKTALVKPIARVNDWVPCSLNVNKLGENRYLFFYPRSGEAHLFMPMRKQHVQLNFDVPAPVKTIRLFGPSLKSAQIWLSKVDPKDGYDRHIWHDLREKHGRDNTWQLPNEPWTKRINACKISAKLIQVHKDVDNRLIISF